MSVFTNGNGVINTSADFRDIQRLRGNVKVVAMFRWCGGFVTGTVIGCADLNSTSLAVIPWRPNEDGSLLAHEFGHTWGLNHNNAANAVMLPILGPNSVVVDQIESNAFR